MKPQRCSTALVGAVCAWLIEPHRASASLRLDSTDLAALEALRTGSPIGGGVALADIDGDGDDDLAIVRPESGVTLLRSGPAGLASDPLSLQPLRRTGSLPGFAAALADIDGDGVIDAVLGASDGASLLLGTATGGFRDVSAFALDGQWRNTSSIALADVDGDGLLDVYLVGYIAGTRWPENRCERDALFLQRPGAPWAVVTLPDAEAHARGCGFGAVFFDHDGDGDVDPWVANDFGSLGIPSHIWTNDGIDATGTLRITSRANATERPVAIYGMGAAVGDVDGDALLDVANTSIGRAPLFRGVAGGHFTDTTEAYGVGGALGRDGRRVTWGVALVDLDGDGATDLLEAGGYIPGDSQLQMASGGTPTLFFRGGPIPWREDPTTIASALGPGEYRGIAIGDVNADGAPDVAFAAAMSTPPALLRNGSAGGPWLSVTPRGTVSPREARGSVVTLQCGSLPRRTAVVPTGGNFGSMSAPRAFLSMAGCIGLDSRLIIEWPSGIRTQTVIDPTRGTQRIVSDEPQWLALDRSVLVLGGLAPSDRATVTIVPRNDTGPLGPGHRVAIRVVAGSAALDPVVDMGNDAYAAVVHARGAGEIWLEIAVDGRTMPRRVRLRAHTWPVASVVQSSPTALSPRRPTDIAIAARRADGSPASLSELPTLTATNAHIEGAVVPIGRGFFVARLVADAPPGSIATVAAMFADAAAVTLQVPVIANVDSAATDVRLQPGYLRVDDIGHASVSVDAFLQSANGDPVTLATANDVRLYRADGSVLGAMAFGEDALVSLFPSAAELPRGPFELRVDGVRVGPPLALRTYTDSAELRAFLALPQTRVLAIQSTLVADGADSTWLLFQPRDAAGNYVPFHDVAWEITGGSIDLASRSSHGAASSWRVTAALGATELTAVARIDATRSVRTSIALTPPAPARVLGQLEVCATGVAIAGAAASEFRITISPRRPDGLLDGAPRRIRAHDNDGEMTLTYGAGAYTVAAAAPASRPSTVIRVVDMGPAIPGDPHEMQVVDFVLPTGDLALDPPRGDGWAGDRRCVSASPPGGNDAGVVDDASPRDAAPDDASASADVVRDDAPRVLAGGGCACGVASRRPPAAPFWRALSGLGIAGGVIRRRRSRRFSPRT